MAKTPACYLSRVGGCVLPMLGWHGMGRAMDCSPNPSQLMIHLGTLSSPNQAPPRFRAPLSSFPSCGLLVGRLSPHLSVSLSPFFFSFFLSFLTSLHLFCHYERHADARETRRDRQPVTIGGGRLARALPHPLVYGATRETSSCWGIILRL